MVRSTSYVSNDLLVRLSSAVDSLQVLSIMAVGKTPLSVEDILARQKAEKEEASKVNTIQAYSDSFASF